MVRRRKVKRGRRTIASSISTTGRRAAGIRARIRDVEIARRATTQRDYREQKVREACRRRRRRSPRCFASSLIIRGVGMREFLFGPSVGWEGEDTGLKRD